MNWDLEEKEHNVSPPFNNQLKISIKEKKDKEGIQIEHIMVGIDAASAFAICFVIWFTGRFKLV